MGDLQPNGFPNNGGWTLSYSSYFKMLQWISLDLGLDLGLHIDLEKECIPLKGGFFFRALYMSLMLTEKFLAGMKENIYNLKCKSMSKDYKI